MFSQNHSPTPPVENAVPGTAYSPVHWQRAIILMDMNAFFASVEQRDFPELRGRPVGITNGKTGTCIITSSYEARMQGIKTGMRLKEARRLCPNIVQRAARPEVYAQVSTRIMRAMEQVCPDIEVFSVDEAFIDATHSQKLYGSAIIIAQLIRQAVFDASGLLCSIGISGDKTTAKYAAKLNKPNGFTVIAPWDAKQALHDVPVTELCGIADGVGRFLADYDVHTCGDMKKLPISVLAKRFGNPGRRIWYMCQGEDPDPLHPDVPAPKSIGHGKVMPPETRDWEVIQTFLLHMCFKIGARLRRHQLEAQHFSAGLRTAYGWTGGKARLAIASGDTQQIYRLCHCILQQNWRNEAVHQIQITALDPKPASQQMDLFAEDVAITDHNNRLNETIDNVNQRYGEFAISPARLLQRSDMPNVIAPAWKPDGHRQTI